MWTLVVLWLLGLPASIVFLGDAAARNSGTHSTPAPHQNTLAIT
jgi:hypothetical protein